MLVANCWVVKAPLLAEEVEDIGGELRIQGTEGGAVSMGLFLSLRIYSGVGRCPSQPSEEVRGVP